MEVAVGTIHVRYNDHKTDTSTDRPCEEIALSKLYANIVLSLGHNSPRQSSLAAGHFPG